MRFTSPILCFLVLVAGCAGDDQVPEQWQPNERGPTSVGAITWAPTTQPNERRDVMVPPNAGPSDYVRLALQRSPSIAAAQQRVMKMAARVPQMTSLEDPMLQVAPIGEMAQTAAGEVGAMAMVSQMIPFPGRLSAKGQIATQEVAQAAAELEQAKLEVIADVRRAYWSYYFAARAIDVTQQTRELLVQFRDIASSRFRAGTATQADVLRAGVELSSLDSEMLSFQQQRSSAMAMLNTLLDRDPTAPLPAPSVAESRNIEMRLESLLSEAAERNPELELIRRRIQTEKARQQLARLGYFPDLTVSVNYNLVDDEGLSMAANGRDQWWVGFGINVPIWWDKYRAAEREALRGRNEAIADLGAAQNRLAFRIQDALTRVQTQQKQVELFSQTILPQARQTVDASRAAYQAGGIDFLALVDSSRLLLGYERMYEQNLSQMEKDFAELEQAIGRNGAEHE